MTINSVKLLTGYMDRSIYGPVQDDSLGEGPKFIIIHYVIIYQ